MISLQGLKEPPTVSIPDSTLDPIPSYKSIWQWLISIFVKTPTEVTRRLLEKFREMMARIRAVKFY